SRSLLRRAAVEPAAEAGGLGVVLGTEPAVRLGPGIARAPPQMVDPDIAGHPRTHCEFPLDVAVRRLRQVRGEQRLADLPVAIGVARRAEQGAVLLADAKVLRRDKAALPEALAPIAGARFIPEEASLG